MKKILLVCLMGFGLISLNAQNSLTNDLNNDFGVIYPDQVKISRPLSEIWAEENIDPDEKTPYEIKNEEAPDKREGKRIPQQFDMSLKAAGLEFKNDEAIIQRTDGSRPSDNTMKVNFAGVGTGGAFPYDPSGAAGPNHYVQAVNATTYRVFNKATGANMGGGTLGNLWTPATGNMGDPIVMYDRFADRWFIAQFGSGNAIYIAVSTTASPLGSYYTFSYTSPQFPDYLKFSIWHDGYYMTSNTGTQRVFCFERSLMLTGGTARSVYQSFSPPRSSGFFCPMPGDADGTTISTGPCPIFSYECSEWGGSFADQINIYQATVTWGATPAMNITAATGSPLNTAAFDGSYDPGWDDIDQPGTTQMLDGIGGIIQYRAQYRVWGTYNSVVICWPVQIASGERSIMWAELRQTGTTWSIYQQGIYDPDAYYRWVGSIAMDDQGNIGMAYAKSGVTPTNVYPSLCYTGRLATDPVGQMTFAETVVQAGTGYQTGANRFGDYAQCTLDPDGVTFWHTSQYNGGSSGSSVQRTRIFSFQIASATPMAGVTITSSDADNSICTGTSVTFTATPTNGGSAPSYQWKLNGNNVGTNSTTYATSTLANGDIVTCVMTSNMPSVGNNPATSNAITTTVNAIVTPSVTIAQTVGTNPSCAGSNVVFTATPVNGGTPSYQWKKNAVNVGTNSAGYSTTTLVNGDVINVVMTSSNSCVTSSTATSNSITMTITPSVTPSVSISATDNNICAGESVTYTATPTNGGTPSYQWKRNTTNVGTNSATFATSTLINGDVITVVMTSTATCPVPATATSNGITMTVNSIPATPTITQNGSVLSSSSATGNQWYLDGNLLPGETNQSITVTQSGVYTVIVTTNGCSSAASAGNNATVGINETENPFLLVAFPNPSDGNFTISFTADRSEKYTLNLYNTLGQIVISKEVSNHSGTYLIPVSINDPATGMYTIVLTNGTQETVKKILLR